MRSNPAQQLTESETAHIMRQIVDGLKYLHAHNILHRDMKLPNLLVTADMRVKIADFGLATQLSRPDEPHMTMCGTPNYISPEVAQRTAHGQPADVWGLGIMMYTLLEGRPPFDTDAVATTLRRVVQAEIKMPERATPEARDLLDRLLQKDQQQRIRLDDVLRHPFMVKHGMTELAGGAADRRDVGAIVQAHDSGVMTMSTTPSISASAGQLVAPAQSFGRSQRFGGAQRQHEPIAEENEGMLQQYDLPPPRKPTAVDSGLVDTYRSSSNLNPFLGGGTDRSASVYNAPTADHRDIGGPMVLGHLQPKQHLQPRFDFNTPSSHRGRTALAPQAHRLHDQQENIPYNQQQQPQVVRGIAAIDVPQLNAERLLPTRYETKKAILSIDGRGRVLVELLRSKAPAKPAQRPADICRISRDGMRIEIVQADALQRSGDIEPDHSAVELYAYPLMPVKHWKKYTYAERFVQLVRAKTPKITYYSALAKCQLMETLDDFELFFYADDDRFTRSPADGVRFVRSGGSGVTVDERDFGVRLDGPTQQQRDHYQHCWQHCGALERALRAMPGDGEVFPCTVGRRPVTVPMVLGNAQQRREQLEQEQRCASVSSPRMPTVSVTWSKDIFAFAFRSSHPLSLMFRAADAIVRHVDQQFDDVARQTVAGRLLHNAQRSDSHTGHRDRIEIGPGRSGGAVQR